MPLPTRPSRPSRRARNPLVIVGNAIFTLMLLVLIVGGGAAVIGKSRFEAPGPLVSSLSKTAGAYPIPVAIVPGHLSDEELDAMS